MAITTASSSPSACRRAVEIEGDRAGPLETNGLQALAEARLPAARGKEGQRRIDEALRQAVRRDQRMAGVSAGAERLAHETGRERGRSFLRLRVEAGEQERTPQAFIERPGARHRFADRLGLQARAESSGGAPNIREARFRALAGAGRTATTEGARR